MDPLQSIAGYPRSSAPALYKVRQKFPSRHIEDVRRHVRQLFEHAAGRPCIQPGQRIAITAGSRGMGQFASILAGVADYVRACGAEPVVIPAMGSHGRSTSEGQTRVLELLGVTPKSIGAPIEATMQTVHVGTAACGAEAHADAIAATTDGIIVVARVGVHPESTTGLASGLLKMITVGLGKQDGARQAHRHGLWAAVRQVPEIVMGKLRICCGVAVIENAYRQPALIELIPPSYDAFLDADQRLLKVAKEHWATLPFKQLDVLVVDRVGKNISGAGIDPNIVGAWRVSAGKKKEPDYHRIVALSLTPESLGNAMGAGIADIVTERFARAYDPHATYINMLTASEPGNTLREPALPIVMPTDRDAIEVAIGAAIPRGELRLCRIRSTSELVEFEISAALVKEVKSIPTLTIMDEGSPLPFDPQGNLTGL
ncbi:MAG TPA: DUF2088 domain-containing protein [Phycisphaerae bacterium]|nr:DUF2088 domain-containing protein [Phycisphaerae bacterium]HOM52943.1 DUF2088 domain-containing protein [Phycisphaerae bacterium]HON67117.1 DUF2088 domain-containing protein [Phycisphaerae bacterium]HOQ87611.1 DUF2088 domain-containing protein [Phycisphaerae bacterium]HPP27208.1 DUF2088 domain-containing protein [Phycisphaerae bacterium]